MNMSKVVTIVFMLVWLSGCNTIGFGKKETDINAETDGVSIEDRDAQAEGIEGSSATGVDIEGTETRVVVGEQDFQGNELNDPASPLSNRVVYFDYDSSTVRMEDQATLEAHARYLGTHSNVTIRLIGHTDERGSREYNLALGESRALSIRRILMLQGAALSQFQVTSYGEERPAIEGHDENAWQQNRRVELIYVGN